MAFFEKWPYTDFQKLNIDWVLKIVHDYEETMKNLNSRIESVIRPMINEQQVYIISYYNTLKSVLNEQINAMIADNKKLDAKVQRQLHDNYIAMNNLDAKVRNTLDDVTAKNQLEISKLRNDVHRLIAKYDAIWNANSVRLNSQIQKITTDFTRDMTAQLADNNSKMAKLWADVTTTVTTLQSEMQDTINKLQMENAQLELNVTGKVDIAINQLIEINTEIKSLLEKQYDNTEDFYNRFVSLVQTTYNILSEAINLKADKIYVDAEFKRLENLINKANSDLQVLNPVTMDYEGLQKTLFDICRVNRAWALTADEYDSVGIYADEYDNISRHTTMDATGYDLRGRFYLLEAPILLHKSYHYTDRAETRIVKRFTEWNQQIEETAAKRWEYLVRCCGEVKHTLETQLYMSSPFDGVLRPLKEILLQLFAELYTDSLNAEQYDNKNITATAYDAIGLSAYDYDWHSGSLIV